MKRLLNRNAHPSIDILNTLVQGEEVFLDGYHLVYLKKGEVEVRGEYFEVLRDGLFFIGEKYNSSKGYVDATPTLLNYDVSLTGFIRMCEDNESR